MERQSGDWWEKSWAWTLHTDIQDRYSIYTGVCAVFGVQVAYTITLTDKDLKARVLPKHCFSGHFAQHYLTHAHSSMSTGECFSSKTERKGERRGGDTTWVVQWQTISVNLIFPCTRPLSLSVSHLNVLHRKTSGGQSNTKDSIFNFFFTKPIYCRPCCYRAGWRCTRLRMSTKRCKTMVKIFSMTKHYSNWVQTGPLANISIHSNAQSASSEVSGAMFKDTQTCKLLLS